MPDPQCVALLRDAFDLLNDRPNFSLRRNRAITSYKLAARMDAYLAGLHVPSAILAVVAKARADWKDDACVSIDEGETQTAQGEDGIWVRAWVLIRCPPTTGGAAGAQTSLQARYESAMQALDPVSREVFILHAVDGLAYPDIARRLAISPGDVERHLAEALAHIDRWFDS